MNKKIVRALDDLNFYLTVEEPCAYLDDLQERKIFTKLEGSEANLLFNELSLRGFRRSQNIAYIPACLNCNACKSSRLLVDKFKFGKSQRRVMNKNINLLRKITPPHPTSAQFRLFNRYIKARHLDGDMSDMGALDYAKMIAETNVNTRLFEYYRLDSVSHENKLVACALTDIMDDGVSMVYSFFDPDMADNSLGKYVILDHIKYAETMNYPYVYLGYYINGSKNMAYKSQFKPQQHFDGNHWLDVE